MGGGISLSSEDSSNEFQNLLSREALKTTNRGGRFNPEEAISLDHNLVLSLSDPVNLNKPAELNEDIVQVGVYSWYIIQSQDFIIRDGTHQFTYRLQEALLAVDRDRKLINIFKKSRRTNLFVTVICYMISVPADNSFRVKSKIRSLGRAHARIGVREEELVMFSEAFIRALINLFQDCCMGMNEVVVIMKAWRTLLRFFLEQMTIEKVVFKDHDFTNALQSSRSDCAITTRVAASHSFKDLISDKTTAYTV